MNTLSACHKPWSLLCSNFRNMHLLQIICRGMLFREQSVASKAESKFSKPLSKPKNQRSKEESLLGEFIIHSETVLGLIRCSNYLAMPGMWLGSSMVAPQNSLVGYSGMLYDGKFSGFLNFWKSKHMIFLEEKPPWRSIFCWSDSNRSSLKNC